ncbi:nuclear transport factor 2 family protein [Streptomyces sp. NBC_00286]|uniref:nuclear transport factor 2 family protein n=1 Tax=Streptomyces sp. NBC_00286 TaxID=2975701 RepID=UPI002E2A5B1A|nr:nuclear transport factor 2 family protein [Streptomyces sp. NBC_00286]
MSETLHSAAATVARWRSAEERGDVEAAVACLSPDVVLSSPLTDQFRFEGSDQLRDFLTVAFAAVKDVRYHTQTGEGDAYALVYRARVGSQSFEEVQMLRLDDQARITEITLFGRPMPALTALMHLMGPALARQQGRRGLATLMSVSTVPIHAMVSSGDRSMVAKTRPAVRRT